MTKDQINNLVTNIGRYIIRVGDNKEIYTTFDFLNYLADKNYITQKESTNIKRFYDGINPCCAKSILHFILVKQLYNKHIHDI